MLKMQKNSTKKLTRINRLAPTSEHSPECVGASPIAPVSLPTTRCDTPQIELQDVECTPPLFIDVETTGLTEQVDGCKFALSITNVRTLAHALNVYLNNHIDSDWGWDNENNEKEIAVQYLTDMRNQFRNIEGYYSVEHQAWLEACENGIVCESGIFSKVE